MPCVYTGPGGSGTDRIGSDLLSGTKWSTYEGDPMWNRTVPVQNRSRVNRLKSDRARVPSLICKNKYFCHCGIIMSCMAVKSLHIESFSDLESENLVRIAKFFV